MRGYTKSGISNVSEDPIKRWTYEQCKEYLQKYPNGLSADMVKKHLKTFVMYDKLNEGDGYIDKEADENEDNEQTVRIDRNKGEEPGLRNAVVGGFEGILKLVLAIPGIFGLVMFVGMCGSKIDWSVTNILCCIGGFGLSFFLGEVFDLD